MDHGSFSGAPEPASDAAEPSAAIPFLDLVDPDLRAGALQMREMTQIFMPMSLEKLPMRREMMASKAAPLLPDVTVVARRVAARPGDHEVDVLVINAQPGTGRPVIVHMHGGGFTASSARGSAPMLQATAKALDCAIVSVDYRNAPEARYNESLEDNYAALLWTYAHADELGIDRTRIALMGESGGGGHAALLAIAARDRGEVPVMFQCLIYPMIDDRTGSAHAMPPHIGAFGWNVDANRFGWRCFLGQEPGTDRVPAAAVPARIDDVAGLPPTFIGVGALDLFVEENIEYGRRLVAAGVPTEMLVVPGAFHGFDMLAPDSAGSRRFTAAKLDALRRAFATPA